MKLVEKLNREDLLSMFKSGELVYTLAEQQFLGKYARHTFSGKTFSYPVEDDETLLEINQAVFAKTVALDLIVARHSQTDYLAEVAKEKAMKVNPFYAAMGVGEVDYEKDPLFALAEIKLKASKCLEQTTKRITFTTDLREDISNQFPEVRKRSRELYGDVPTLVFGSSITKNNKANDIDIKVIVPNFSEKVYQKIKGTNYSERNLPLNFIIVPAEYLNSWVLSDSHPAFQSDYSRLVNGSLTVPILDHERKRDLRRQNTIDRYIEARKALTPEELFRSENILPRINNRLKIPKFVHWYFSDYCNSEIKKPDIIRFDSLPDRETFIDALVETNLNLNKMFKTVYQNSPSQL